MVTGKKLKDITKEERQFGKAINFGLLFGMGAPGLIRYAKWNYGVELTMKKARNAVATFRNAYSGYTKWQKLQRDACGIAGHVSTKLGKRRKLSDNFIYTCSVNHPVQGTAAEIMLNALCTVHKKFKSNKIKMINCVHDELLIECKVKDTVYAKAALQECMETAMHEIFPKATLKDLVEVKTGKTWEDCH